MCIYGSYGFQSKLWAVPPPAPPPQRPLQSPLRASSHVIPGLSLRGWGSPGFRLRCPSEGQAPCAGSAPGLSGQQEPVCSFCGRLSSGHPQVREAGPPWAAWSGGGGGPASGLSPCGQEDSFPVRELGHTRGGEGAILLGAPVGEKCTEPHAGDTPALSSCGLF